MPKNSRRAAAVVALLGLLVAGAPASGAAPRPGQIVEVSLDGLLRVEVAGVRMWAVLDGYALTPKAFSGLRAYVPAGARLQIDVVRTSPVTTIRARFKGADLGPQLAARGLARRTGGGPSD